MRRRVLPHPTVLYRRVPRSQFLRLVDAGFFDFRWTSLVLDDARRWNLEHVPNLKPRDLNHIWDVVYDAYPEALVLDEDAHDAAERLKRVPLETRDLHILAAAVAGEVDSIVTTDPTSVSVETYSYFGIAVLSFDMLLCQCWSHNEFAVLQTFIEQAVERSYSPSEMFQRLIYPLNHDAPEFVQRMLGIYAPDKTVLTRFYRYLGLD